LQKEQLKRVTVEKIFTIEIFSCDCVIMEKIFFATLEQGSEVPCRAGDKGSAIVATNSALLVFVQKTSEKLTHSVVAPLSHKAKNRLCGTPGDKPIPILYSFNQLIQLKR